MVWGFFGHLIFHRIFQGPMEWEEGNYMKWLKALACGPFAWIFLVAVYWAGIVGRD
jgi:hypothetical protein